MSLHIRKSFGPSALIATVLLIHTCTAAAADAAGDLQQQIRELLAGTITTQSAQPSERRDDRAVSRTADLQELERRLLLGATDSRIQGTQAMTRPESVAGMSTVKKDLLAHDDAQASARRLLLGR
ncbi:MAG: hypothetical protein WCB10_05745 [Steroidobacteraceae bacterium]